MEMNKVGSCYWKRLSLLGLPQNVRRQIYQYCAGDETRKELSVEEHFMEIRATDHYIGLGTRHGHPYFFAVDAEERRRVRPAVKTLTMLRTYNRLRSINRAANIDIKNFIFETYWIVLHGPALEQISHLIESASIHCAKRLLVGLGYELCDIVGCRGKPFDWYEQNFRGVRSCPGSDLVTMCTQKACTDAVRDSLPGWHRLVAYISDIPSCMVTHLGLVCQVETEDLAKEIVAPLKSLRLPICDVRFLVPYHRQGYTKQMMKDARMLKAIAMQTVKLVTNHKFTPPTAFRFLDLPTELRQHTLRFTDLVPATHCLFWTDRSGYYRSWAGDQSRMFGCQSLNVFCSNIQDGGWPRCTCSRSPLSMFLVCRLMTHDARQIFYSENRFVIPDHQSEVNTPGSPMRKRTFEAANFLRFLYPSSLSCIREIEITFTYRYSTHEGVFLSVLQDWEQALVAAAPYLRAVTLTVILGTQIVVHRIGVGAKDPSAAAAARLKTYEQMVHPLKRISASLKNLFIHAYVPTHLGSPMTYDQDRGSILRRQGPCPEVSRRLERMVMGESYDSLCAGKMPPDADI